MAQQDIIREFLVALGFKVDESSLSKFKRGIADATKAVAKMALAVEGAALSVGIAVQRFASGMEVLYFAGQRTGTTVKGIKAVQFAARQLGASSEEAMGSLESLARFMRNTPASEAWLKGMLGVDTRDASGNMRGLDEVLTDVGKALAAMPTYQANGLAGVLGIDEKMMLAIRSGDFGRFVEQYRNLTGNTDFEGAAQKAHAFQERLRDLGDRASAAGVQVGDNLLNVFGPDMERAAKWAEEHSDEIATAVTRMAKALETTVRVADGLIRRIVEGWGYIFSGLKSAYNALPAPVRKWIEDKASAFAEWVSPGGPTAPSSAPAPAANAPRGIRNNNPGNLNFVGQAGATRENGSGRFAAFGSAQEGLAALANQLDIYRRRGIDTVQAIISKWAPPSENNTGAYVDRVSRALGVSPTDRLNMLDPSVMSRMMDAIIRHENGMNPYGSDMLMSAAKGARGATMSQQTTINVYGSGSASDTGRAVGAEQDRVNQRLARTFAGAMP